MMLYHAGKVPEIVCSVMGTLVQPRTLIDRETQLSPRTASEEYQLLYTMRSRSSHQQVIKIIITSFREQQVS